MKTARSGSLSPATSRSVSNDADLPPESVPAHQDVDEPEVLAVEHDHPRAGAEDGPLEAPDRLVEPVQPHQAHERRRLAAGDDQTVEVRQLLGLAHLDDVDAETAQHRAVLAEVPLYGEHSDSKLLHGRNGIREYPER